MALPAIGQLAKSIYRQGKPELLQQAPWHAAAVSHLARKRSQVWFPAPVDALPIHLFSTLPSFRNISKGL